MKLYLNNIPAELQLNKAKACDKETPFLDLDIKLVDDDTHTRVCDKRNDFIFPIVNFPGCVMMSLDSNPTVSTFHSWFFLLGAALAFSIFILKIYKSTVVTGLQISQSS